MAEIRCPNCGRNNPDLLDVCQFCMTPLKPDAVLRAGEQPTKKHTGELEPILPDWLKDVRQQARDSADEDAAQAATRPKAKDEPPDLLAGLASQTGSEEENVPDWLASITPPAESTAGAAPSTSSETDFFAQLDRSRSHPQGEPSEGTVYKSEEQDELSDWFSRAAGQPEETIELDEDPLPLEGGWASSPDVPVPAPRQPAPQEEDLSWLRNLEETSKQTGDLKPPKLESDRTASFEAPFTSSPFESSQEDLSWLDSLGGIPEPSQPPRTESPSTQDDLSWLNNLGATPEPVQPFDAAPDRPLAQESRSPGEDLDWLKDLGAPTESTSPSDSPTPETSPKAFSDEDLSWLHQLDEASQASQPFDAANPAAPIEQPAWLRDLGQQEGPSSAPPFVESELRGVNEEQKEPEPDWLRNTAESSSMPETGDISTDWLKEESADHLPTHSERVPEPTPLTDSFSSQVDDPSLSNQELDSLFSTEMPDWLSRTEPGNESAQTLPVPPPSAGEESLAPVELPAWVQAMRPVEALISEATPGAEDQPEEKQGPLAGLRGVIPGVSIGPSAKPRAVSLKLQVTPEQQASAGLLEQILATETTPRPLVDAPFVAAQHLLRWALAGFFLLVLGAVISLRSQNMPVAAGLPSEGSNLANAVLRIPANSRVLVVVDYEPSLAGEMEAISSPLLNQMVSLGRHNLSFLATSPTGPALVERLLTSARINTADGFGYQAGVQYRNLGFLPGGSAGVLGFIEGPASVVPGADVAAFSDYAAVVVLTDHVESGRIWVEQLQSRREVDFVLANQPLLVVASAQAGPLLQPYVASGQVEGMISGLSDAARYDANSGRSSAARLYWDPFGAGVMMAVIAIVVGSLWNLLGGMRARRPQAGQG